MKVTTDVKKLNAIIQEELLEIIKKPWLESTLIAIGNTKGVQIQIIMTREAEAFIDSDEFICVTPVESTNEQE